MLRQRSSQLQKYKSARMSRRIAVDHSEGMRRGWWTRRVDSL